jgi:hypothetical protein
MDVIQKAIVRYKDKYNITIREVKKDEGRVIIEISQDKTLDNKYLSAQELREIAKSLFVSVHDNFHIGAIEYVPLAQDKVDFKWLKAQLADHSMKIKTLANTLGIRKSIIADHHSGNKRITNEEQAMYYYFFKSM